jgi:hypothetical protein
MDTVPPQAPVLPSLDRIRAGLEPAAHRRTPMWLLLLVAMFAAVAGVSAAGVMILGPGGAPGGMHGEPLSR